MPFSVTVPNANQSPGLFPAQNNTNFQRLKDMINNDHIFSDAFVPQEGTHKKVTLTNLFPTPSGALAFGNGIIYCDDDPQGKSQVNWYNGDTHQALSGLDRSFALKVSGNVSLASSASATVFPNPGYNYSGTFWATIQNQASFSFYSIIRAGINNVNLIDGSSGGFAAQPTMSFTGNDIRVTNNSTQTRIISWTMIYTRLD